VTVLACIRLCPWTQTCETCNQQWIICSKISLQECESASCTCTALFPSQLIHFP